MAKRQPPALIVAWRPPAAVGERDRILSFVGPAEERALQAAFPDRVVAARAVAADVRQQALDAFVRVCDGIGDVADAKGRTFRAALRRGAGSSDWWFHPLSSGSWGSGPPVLEWIVAVFTIDRCASGHGLTRLVLYGAPRAVAIALRARYQVRVIGGAPAGVRRGQAWWTAMVSRWSLLASTLRAARAAPPPIAPPGSDRPLVALSALWKLWVHWDERREALVDTWFTGLDAALERRGCSVVRLAWLPPAVVAAPGESWRRPFVRGDAVALQSYLTWRDIIRETVSPRPWMVYRAWRGRAAFRAVFRLDGFDLWPCFRFALTQPFLDAQIASSRLLALSIARACGASRPEVLLCHFEQLPTGCSHYDGVRRSRGGARTCAMQHSTNMKGRFYVTGAGAGSAPDADAIPRPDYIFVTGDAGVERFVASGYRPAQLLRTGSIRFDRVTEMRAAVSRQRGAARAAEEPRPVRVLVLPSGDRDMEIVEAVCGAVEEQDGFEIRVRQKPGGDMRRQPRFAALAPRVRLTSGSLVDDIAEADVVLFAESTAGDQAFASGVPTWQWMPVAAEGSTLADSARLPRFHAIAPLRDALRAFRIDPRPFLPREADIDRVCRYVFGASDGQAAERMAAAIAALASDRGGK